MKKTKKRGPVQRKRKQPDNFTIEKKGTLLETLYELFPQKKKGLLKSVLKDKQVFVNGRWITQFDHPLKPGQKLEVRWEKQSQEELPHRLKLIFEDEDLIVVDKPSGLLTVATAKEKRKTAYAILSDHVKKANPDNKIFIIHRIDRETSGLLMFAKNESMKNQIQENWSSTIEQRTYVAVVEGVMETKEGTLKSYLKESSAFTVYSSQNPQHGQEAITHYKVLEVNDEFSLVQVNLETGRKHQIRVHMQDLNHPIVGDPKYGATVNPIRRMGLHAQVLAFTHPKTGEICRFETPIPGKFRHVFTYKK